MCQNSVLFKFSGIYPANINIVVLFFTHLFINFVCAAGNGVACSAFKEAVVYNFLQRGGSVPVRSARNTGTAR